MTFPKQLLHSPICHSMVNAIIHQHLYSYLQQEMENQFVERALDNRAIFKLLQCSNRFIPNNFPIVAKLTTATKLAAAAEKSKSKATLPKEYEDFASVFSQETTTHLPLSRPYDHEINLKETFTPKIRKLYPLSPDERTAMDMFMDEHLASGKICPSNSPQASPFFFVKKKDRGLHPRQDY